MNMTQMVGIMVLCYFVSLFVLSFLHKHINIRLGNTIFIIADLIFFFAWNYASYLRGWLDDGFMTLANISPFTMTLIPLVPLLSPKVREYCNAAIAFLWVGMFFALIISPGNAYLFNYNYEATFAYSSEAACHLLVSVYGFYLIISGQVKCDFKNWTRSLICMYSVITFGVFLNFVFHLNNFGMDPYDGASIYMIDIFGGFWATLVAYYFGVLLVLTVGMQAGYGIKKLVEGANVETDAKDMANAATGTATESEVSDASASLEYETNDGSEFDDSNESNTRQTKINQ